MPRPIDERQLAFFGAFCLFLSTLEALVPKPLPFLRLGLANLPILLSLRRGPQCAMDGKPSGGSLRFTLSLVVLKIAGQGLVGGTLFSYVFLFSAAGSAASAALMIGSARLFGEKLSLAGISVLGCLASNLAQIFFARYLLLGEGVWLIAPPFFLLGTLSGFLLGVFSQAMRENSAWLASCAAAGRVPLAQSAPVCPTAFFYAVCGLASVFPFLRTEQTAAKLFLAAFFMACAAFSGKRIRIVPNIVLALAVTAAHCTVPFGKVLFMLGGYPVSEGALRAGLSRSAAVIGLVYLSRFAVRPRLRFPGRAGRIFSAMLSDFERITRCGLKIERRDFWASLDRLLAAAYSSRNEASFSASGAEKLVPRQIAAGLFFTAVSWAVFLFYGN
jgi:uncharacterized membrane protein